MKRIAVILLILAGFGTAAWSQMGGGMMDRSTQQLYPHSYSQRVTQGREAIFIVEIVPICATVR